MQLIECVPNFSEGRDLKVIDQIASAVTSVQGAHLLHRDIGHSANRTVFTIAGQAEAVLEAAYRAIECASKLIDMSKHSGEHPRIGATDVCPIIPLSNISMGECVDLSKQLAKRVGDELKIPVYLYGESASYVERKNLVYLRKGEYEKLALRMKEMAFKPDYGPNQFNAKFGATVIGARPILIAYNVNLNTKNINIAKTIARLIRKKRQDYQTGLLKTNSSSSDEITWQDITAIGWYMEEYGCCQISTNLLNYKSTGIYQTYTGISKLASEFGISVTGSEIIGLIPLSALLDVSNCMLKQSGSIKANSEHDLLNSAITFLNLSQFRPFKVEEKVLEYKLAELGIHI